MKKIFLLVFLVFTFSSCEKFYTHQFKLQNNTNDTLWINYIESNSSFKSQFPDTLRRFRFIPNKITPRAIYTITGDNKTTAPDNYKERIDIFSKLEIATIKTIFPDTTGIGKFDTSAFIQKDYLDRSFWDYFIDENQDAGVYLFEINDADLE
ncbi:hypothetical protein Fleli_1343 [Bernardetia litoralis DSM 6794]|uniref:Lipoprotein n=1 Tax=Bernardetia litoralis (strain ATCC 23117 / DSM 6794 / NBRC 15988 / NCIMB 1366 / Fx l1 / Sio-4) TaxID=880071 RepID=I4AIJ0_BERLS|nr:hypothetical protein [Bernardetia litoralis]AFM03775.1 hypothetical protein Fleli_1343 [Bernardetia litoralis DSM 6794]